MAGSVVVLGAGATKSVGGPLTNEILPDMMKHAADVDPQGRLSAFLQQTFRVPPAGATKEQYPGLPLLMSLVDTAISRNQDFVHPQWPADSVAQIRHLIEGGIFDLLEQRLQHGPTNNHWNLLAALFPTPQQPSVITLNYDLIIDAAMMFYSQKDDPEGRFPNYCCDIQTDFYRDSPQRFGTLLKLHGSLNWLYCRTCQRLEIGASESRKYVKILEKLLATRPGLEKSYKTQDSPCPVCHAVLRPLLVAPSHLKDYRNPHLTQVWYHAERVLRQADQVIFVGYSLPDDDVEVVYLLKRGLAHLAPNRVTVVEYYDHNLQEPDRTVAERRAEEVRRRYSTLFGDGIDWHTNGLDGWLAVRQSAAAAAQ